MSEIVANIGTRKKVTFWNYFWSILWFIALILLILKFAVFQQVTVVGKSMSPNYENGQLLLVNQLSKSLQRGQVAAVYEDEKIAKNADYFTRFSARFFLKRIVGLPNEQIEIIGSKVIIYDAKNPEGQVLVENYIPNGTIQTEEDRDFYMPKTKIPDKHYFLMGDNRSNSRDSRELGTFIDFSIFGQETVRFWPANETTVFFLPEYKFQPVSQEIKDKKTRLEKLVPNNQINFTI